MQARTVFGAWDPGIISSHYNASNFHATEFLSAEEKNKMEWKCRICQRENKDTYICPRCGFDESKNYIKYDSVMVLQEKDKANLRELFSKRWSTEGEENVVERENKYFLDSIDGQYSYKMVSKKVIIGRERSMKKYLRTKSYVSRLHAKLFISDGFLYIENISNTNYTYVNNKKITRKTKLNNGDEIGLGGTNIDGRRQLQAAYFNVRIE